MLTVLVAAAVTYLLTPLVRRGAMAAGAMHAGRDRDVHVEPVPLLGGLAMYGGLAAGLLLAGQVAAGAILVWSGAQVSWLPEPGGGTLILTQDQGTALTILVVVATINAVNFIDGLDGLAAGIVGIG